MNSKLLHPLCFLTMLFCTSPVVADTHVYVGGANGNWDTGANWTPAQEPAPTDVANIGNGFGPEITSTGNQVDTLNTGNGGMGTFAISGTGSLISRRTIFGSVVGEIGTGTMNGTGTFSNTTFNLGEGGTGTFTLNAGNLTSGSFIFGLNAPGTGTLNINGPNAVANSTGVLTVGSSGTGILNVTNGGKITNSGAANIGNVAGSIGTTLVDGANSLWQATSNILNIGNAGTGTLNITNGGTMNAMTTSSNGITLGTTGNGTININGADSTMTINTTALRIGLGGIGTVNITNGGALNAKITTLGVNAGSNGALLINGPGSTMISTITNVRNGSVTINNGGHLTSSATTLGGGPTGTTATAIVDGAGSQWVTTGFTIGDTSNGILDVTNGGHMQTEQVILGDSHENRMGGGTVTLDNASWNVTGSVNVGGWQSSTLSILNGGDFTLSNRLNVSNGPGNGTVLVDGAGSILTVLTGSEVVEIGKGTTGSGFLTIQNGGTAIFNTQMFIGNRSTTTFGEVVVTGAGSSLTVTGGTVIANPTSANLFVLDGATVNTGSVKTAGGATVTATMLIDDATWNISNTGIDSPALLGLRGTSLLTIQNGGAVNVTGGGMGMAVNAESVSILNIENGAGAAGILNVPSVTGGVGTAIVNFNHTDVAYNFAPAMQGNLTVNQMNTGTTILAGDSNYTGSTNVTNGILRANIVNAFSENSNYVVTTGNLELNNLNNEIGSLSGNGNVTLGTGTLTTGSSASTLWSGNISGTGGLTKTGATVFFLNTAQNYTGLTTVNQGSLHAGVQDVITASSGLTVNSNGIFNMGRFDQTINGNVYNDGLISFGAIGNELTIVGNLTGNGTFFMETDVAAGIGDHITVMGTSAGSHVLRILNLGGTPANPFQALEIVDTTDGSAQFAAAGGTVDVGLYAYEVIRGNGLVQTPDPTNWYLANTLQASEGARAILNTAASLSSLWFTQMDNLHRRMGKQRLIDPSAHPYDIWMRGYIRDLDVGAGVSGRPFEERFNGIDAGIDKVVYAGDSDTVLAGIFIGRGRAGRTFNDFGSKGNTHTSYGGLYGTWFNEKKYYIDLTAKAQHFRNEFDALDGSGNLHHGDYENWGYGSSIETGRRFDIGDKGWVVEPQLQLQYLYLPAKTYVTRRRSEVAVETNNIFQARAGLELGKAIILEGKGILYPYVRTSVIEQFSNGGEISADTLSFTPNLDGTQLEYGAGLIYQVDNQLQGYIAVTRAHGDAYDTPRAANVGFRYEF